MARNCGIALIAWVALVAGYAYALRGEYVAALIVGSVVWVGLVIATGARYQLRDWRARNRAARGERPEDGDLATAIGTIHPTFEPLHAPISGRACVLYSYEIIGRGQGPDSVRDYAGFGMTRCSIRTRHGEFLLGTFPAIESVMHYENADRDAAERFVRETAFEPLDSVLTLTRRMLEVFMTPPPLRKDWRIGRPSAELGLALEKLIEPGESVTVTGRFVSASNSLAGDTKDKGYLRLRRGAEPPVESAVPWIPIRNFLGGLLVIAAANAALWYYVSAGAA